MLIGHSQKSHHRWRWDWDPTVPTVEMIDPLVNPRINRSRVWQLMFIMLLFKYIYLSMRQRWISWSWIHEHFLCEEFLGIGEPKLNWFSLIWSSLMLVFFFFFFWVDRHWYHCRGNHYHIDSFLKTPCYICLLFPVWQHVLGKCQFRLFSNMCFGPEEINRRIHKKRLNPYFQFSPRNSAFFLSFFLVFNLLLLGWEVL